MSEPKRKRKMRGWVKLILILGCVLATAVLGVIGYLGLTLQRMRQPPLLLEMPEPTAVAERTPEPGVEDLDEVSDAAMIEKIESSKQEEKEEPLHDVDVYLIYGVDSRHGQLDRSRSDVIMFFAVDWDTNAIRLVSMQRDILIEIPGKELNRINASYAWGGLDLALLTMEHNFDITPDNVFVVNFQGTVEIIDALGGVEIDVHESDIYEWTRWEGLKSPGRQILTGAQALAYMRNRRNGGDVRRTQRQRNVVTSLLNRRKTFSLPQILTVINTIPNHFYTDMTEVEMVKFITKMIKEEDMEIEQLSIPIEGSFEYASYKGMAVVDMDFVTNREVLHNFIYWGEVKTVVEEALE